jgi:cyclopropane fatty-acyl-phospholipid synthase-like methyltransferase
MPWYHPELDKDFKAILKKMNIETGKVLDLCTGPGTQAIALAKMGFEVTATDISHTAIKKAEIRAQDHETNIRFIQNDIMNSKLTETFDYIFDRGCFHCFDPEDRPAYTQMVHKTLKPGGHLFLKCFSTREQWDEGPFKINPDIIHENFIPSRFDIISIEHTMFEGGRKPKALFCVMRKV